MGKKVHPADLAAWRSISTAKAFKVYYKPGPFVPDINQVFEVTEGKPWLALIAARNLAAEITKMVGGGRRPMVMALLPEGRHEFVPSFYCMVRPRPGKSSI